MVYGAINEKGEKYYTYLPKLFDAIDNAQKNYMQITTYLRCHGDQSFHTSMPSSSRLAT